ncbi:MAG: stage II sporulation protein E [Desulfotomaculum sp.]|nr:stage II sporulation protein E [Desulfotomaculum sp.]
MYDDIDIYPYRRAGESSGDQFKEVGKKRFGFKPKINKAMIKQAFTARWLFLYIMAFFLGRAMLLGELMPFGIAFVAAMTKVSGSKSLGVLFFALLGLATVSGGLALVSSGLVMLAVYLFLCRLRIVWQREWYIGPGAVLIIVLIIKYSFTAYAAGVAYDYISVLFEAVFAGVLTLAFIHAIPPLWQRTAPECINKEALFCILLLFGGVVAGTGAIEWGLVSLRGLVSNLIILLAALLGGAGLGAAAGAMIGVIPGLSYVLVPVLIGAYSFAGLMAGLLRRFGRFGVAAGFLLGNIILSIYVTDYGNMLGVLLEAALAIVLFCLIPASWLEHIAKTLPLPRDIKLYQPALPQAQVKEMTAKRMLDWAKVFTELAGNFKQASATVEDYQEEKSLEQLFEKVGQKVCRGCALYRTCWEREFHQTYQRILNLLADVETNGVLTVADLPENLQKRCARLKEMVIAITCLHDNFKLNNYWQKKLLDSRQLVSEQLQGISEIMINMSGELAKEIETAGKLEAEITKRLKRAGITVTDLFTFHQQDGRLEISLTSPGCEGQLVCHQKIATIITAVAGQQLVLAHTGCCRHAGQQECTLKFYSALNYRLAVGSASVAQGGNAISGDTYHYYST